MARAPAVPPAALSNALPQRIPGPLPSPHFDSLSIVPTPHPPDAPPPPRSQPVAVPPVPVPSFGDLSAGEQAALAGRSRMPVGIVVAGVIGVLAFAAFLALMGGWIASNDPPPPAVNGPKK